MMNTHEQMPPQDALEQRLRRHLTATYGPPPAPDDVWQRLAGRLTDSTPDGRASAPSDPPMSPFNPHDTHATSANPAQLAPARAARWPSPRRLRCQRSPRCCSSLCWPP